MNTKKHFSPAMAMQDITPINPDTARLARRIMAHKRRGSLFDIADSGVDDYVSSVVDNDENLAFDAAMSTPEMRDFLEKMRDLRRVSSGQWWQLCMSEYGINEEAGVVNGGRGAGRSTMHLRALKAP